MRLFLFAQHSVILSNCLTSRVCLRTSLVVKTWDGFSTGMIRRLLHFRQQWSTPKLVMPCTSIAWPKPFLMGSQLSPVAQCFMPAQNRPLFLHASSGSNSFSGLWKNAHAMAIFILVLVCYLLIIITQLSSVIHKNFHAHMIPARTTSDDTKYAERPLFNVHKLFWCWPHPPIFSLQTTSLM